MALPLNTWNSHYTFFAAFSSVVVSFFALLATVMLLFTEQFTSDFDIDMPDVFHFFTGLGTTGVAVVWLLFIAVVVGMFFSERDHITIPLLIIIAGLTCFYFLTMMGACSGIWGCGMRVVM